MASKLASDNGNAAVVHLDPYGLHQTAAVSSQVSNLRHRHANEPHAATSPSIYTINDHLVFSIDIEELVPRKGWIPFRCRADFPRPSRPTEICLCAGSPSVIMSRT